MTKDRKEKQGVRTRAETRRPKLDFMQSFPIYRTENEMI